MPPKFKLLSFWLAYSYFSNIVVILLSEYNLAIYEYNSTNLANYSTTLIPAFIGLFLIPIIVFPFAFHAYNLIEKSPTRARRFADLCFALGLILIASEAYALRQATLRLEPLWSIVFYVLLIFTALLFILSSITAPKYWLIYMTFLVTSVFPYIFLLTGFGIGYSLTTIWLILNAHNHSILNTRLSK